MQNVVIQAEGVQAGGPQVIDGFDLGGQSMPGGSGEQAAAAGCADIRLKSAQCVTFLDLPVELAAGHRLEGVRQRSKQDVPTVGPVSASAV